MKIFVINLDRDIERYERISSNLNQLGLSWERVSGVDGKTMTPDELSVYDENAAIRVGGVPLTRGHIGCSLSHIRLYERIVREGIPQALILEDDMLLDERLQSFLDDTRLTTTTWDYIHASYTPMSVHWLIQWARSSVKMIRQQPFFAVYVFVKIPYIVFVGIYEIVREFLCARFGSRIVRFLRPVYHTGAYALSLSGAQKILRIAYPLRFSADQLVNQARIKAGLRFRGYCPAPVRKSDAFVSNTR